MDLCDQVLREPGPLWPELGHWLGLMYCDSKVPNWSWTSVTRFFVSQDLCDRNLGTDWDLMYCDSKVLNWSWTSVTRLFVSQDLCDRNLGNDRDLTHWNWNRLDQTELETRTIYGMETWLLNTFFVLFHWRSFSILQSHIDSWLGVMWGL